MSAKLENLTPYAQMAPTLVADLDGLTVNVRGFGDKEPFGFGAVIHSRDFDSLDQAQAFVDSINSKPDGIGYSPLALSHLVDMVDVEGLTMPEQMQLLPSAVNALIRDFSPSEPNPDEAAEFSRWLASSSISNTGTNSHGEKKPC